MPYVFNICQFNYIILQNSLICKRFPKKSKKPSSDEIFGRDASFFVSFRKTVDEKHKIHYNKNIKPKSAAEFVRIAVFCEVN